MNNVLVTGSSGMLGKELKLVSKDYINLNVHFKKKSNLDISKKSDLKSH